MAFESLSDKLAAAFKKLRSKGKLTEADVRESMREVRLALLEADVNFKVARDFIKSVTEKCVGETVLSSLTPAQQVIKIVNDELIALMGGEQSRIHQNSKGPTVIMMCGLQGSGKTTHSAKLARMFRSEGKRPLLVACDIYRPAAIEQLKVVGERANTPVFEMGQTDPVEIAKAALRHAKDYGNDFVILDTAGRLHIDEVLMEELKRIKEAVHPDEILLVVDAMTGQDAVNVSDTFNRELGIDGIILTKLDGDTRGGAAISVKAVTGKPIKLIGTGEKLAEPEIFHPDRMASRILGMGDVLSLIEKAESTIDEKSAATLERKMRTQSFTLEDYLDQMKQLSNMGSITDVLKMIPGVGSKLKDVQIDEDKVARAQKKNVAIILSMTRMERRNPDILNASRKRRIAAGSGATVQDVNLLLKQFDQARGMMKQVMGMRGKKRMKLPFGMK